MRGKWLVVIAVASLCLNVAVVASYAYHQSKSRGRMHRPMAGLGREARREMEKIRDEAYPQLRGLAEQLSACHMAMNDLVDDPQVDARRLDSIAGEMARIWTQMSIATFKTARRIYERLPEERRPMFLRSLGPWRGPEDGPRPPWHQRGGPFGHGRGPESCPPPGMEPPPPPEGGK
jgi:Spy/CpxP family protein refolding chaperone